MPGQWARAINVGSLAFGTLQEGHMDFGLQDRVAIITGASYGIGRAIAESFIRKG